METNNVESAMSKQILNRDEDREIYAINEFQMQFKPHLQATMAHAGFSPSEQAANSTIYLQCMHMVVLCSFEKLHGYKHASHYDISDDEHRYLDWLRRESSYNEDHRLDIALKSFEKGLPKYLQQIMLKSGYRAIETSETNALHISLFSNALSIEAEELIRAKSETSGNAINKKRSREDAFSQVASSNLSCEEIKPFFHSIKLVKITKRHHVYYVSTVAGIRALKAAITDNPTVHDVQNLGNEFKIGSKISHHSFRKTHAKTNYQGKKALLLEWAHGSPLSEFSKLNVTNFLKVARDIISCLLAMHINKICHLNLTCDHIILDPHRNTIKIIGYGSSSLFCSKQSHDPKLLEKDVRYISPEQTGMMNREVDFRSDFYSLGIIFYRLLVGRHPFEGNSASKIIKMHVFHEIQPVHKIDPNIPLPVSDMISKLIEKDVDLRYQSAKGIMHDIELVISEHKPGVEIVIAEHDISETLLIPQKLYGRNAEYRMLLSAYNRTVSSSSFELVFLKGNSGIGKTALALELNKHVIRNGIFISGKYDCSESEPYSALIKAVKMFCDMILLEDENMIEKYRSLIKKAVREEGQLLTNVIDNLHHIIGQQPDIFESFGLNAKNRFNHVFINFFKSIASVSPLVIVLKDLQWMDFASIDLITALVKSSITNLMLIGVYRDNEINDKHRLVTFLNTSKNKDINTTVIHLKKLDQECINELISDVLCISALDSYPLTALIYKKTNGNPFFVRQMIHTFLEQKIITFSDEKRKWQWDNCIFGANDLSDDVLDLLRQKILSLSKGAQKALKVASCLGSPFSVSLLVLIINDKISVGDALASGIITHKGCDKCCFVHDQIQNAAKSLLPRDPKPFFLDLARTFLRRLSTVDIEDNICDITNLYYIAKDDIIHENERYEVAEIFRLAGKRAMVSTAYNEALKHFESGIELLGRDGWKSGYSLCLDFHCNAAKSAYSKANYERMNHFIEEISKNATSLLDVVTPYLLVIRMHSDKLMYEDAIQSALSILDKLGDSIELNQSTIASEIVKTKNLVVESIHSILEMRDMEDKTLLSIMEILNSALYSCFHSGNHHVLASMALKMIQLSLKYGISKYSCLGFCAFALILCNKGDNFSYDFGRLSLDLLKKSNYKEMIPMVHLAFFVGISPFFAPLHSSLAPLRRTIYVSLEVCLHHFTINLVSSYCYHSLVCGEPLSKLIDDISQFEEVLTIRNIQYASVHQAVLNLQDIEIENPSKLSGEVFDYTCCFDKDGVKSDIVRTSTTCCIIAYLFDDIQTASKLIEICKKLEAYFGTVFYKVIFYFYEGLVASSMARSAEKKDDFIEIIKRDIDKLERYADNAPENFRNKIMLLEAELAILQKKESEVKSHYQKAISLSNKNGFPNEVALVFERAAIFYLDLDSDLYATKLLLQSYKCYQTWGAYSKMSHMIQRYPILKATLKDSSIVLNSGPNKNITNNDSVESVSVLTDTFSSASIKD